MTPPCLIENSYEGVLLDSFSERREALIYRTVDVEFVARPTYHHRLWGQRGSKESQSLDTDLIFVSALIFSSLLHVFAKYTSRSYSMGKIQLRG
jgi:hypothetical protein